MSFIKHFPTPSWQDFFSEDFQTEATTLLENGNILFFPKLAFHLNTHEQEILSPRFINKTSKNISFHFSTKEVRGLLKKISKEKYILHQSLLSRFAEEAQRFVNKLFPHYANVLRIGRTSYRPVEIKGRISSYRKDDTRLHVDAFPANPNQGWRILRVFCNINPHHQPRVWRVGEPFEKVAQQFLPILRQPIPGMAKFLYALGITKSYRTAYDHYMLQLHNKMKRDDIYQKNAQQQEIHFPSRSTWIVQTDHVSHAAMSGQFMLEQTFYLPAHAMLQPDKSPLFVLEKLLNKRLV